MEAEKETGTLNLVAYQDDRSGKWSLLMFDDPDAAAESFDNLAGDKAAVVGPYAIGPELSKSFGVAAAATDAGFELLELLDELLNDVAETNVPLDEFDDDEDDDE